jgi:hypothetical protein
LFRRVVPVLNEDTFALMCLLEERADPYRQCLDLARQALDQFPPDGPLAKGVAEIAEEAREELATTLRAGIEAMDDAAVSEHVRTGLIDWRDVAREFIADILFTPEDG